MREANAFTRTRISRIGNDGAAMKGMMDIIFVVMVSREVNIA
jgi:hypothetical protein